MKLERWALHFYRLPYTREVVWSNAVERDGIYALLELVGQDGARGIAEGTIKATWSGVSLRSLRAAAEDVVMPRLRGVDLSDDEALAAALAPIPENRLLKGMVQSAALLAAAMAQGTPLWRRWGGARSVELCWTITRARPEAMAADAAEHCARYGFRVLKVKGGQGMEVDLAALAAIRSEVGEGIELYVDANGAYPRAQALEYVQRIAQAGARVAEDPCPLAPDADFEALQRECGIPVLVDASCTSLRDAELYLARGVRAVSAKPGRIGLAASRAIAELVARRGAHVAVGIYAESALGTLVSLQLPGTLPAEQSFFLLQATQVLREAPPIRGGRLELPETADLAALVDWEKLRRNGV